MPEGCANTAGGFVKGLMSLIYSILSFIADKFLGEHIRKRYSKEFNALSSDEKYSLICENLSSNQRMLNIILRVTFICFVISGITNTTVLIELPICVIGVVNLFFCLRFIAICFIGMTTTKLNWKNIAIKLSAGLIVSGFLLIMASVFPPLAFVLIGLTIYKNWERRAFVDKYKRYNRLYWKTAGIALMFGLIQVISLFISFFVAILAHAVDIAKVGTGTEEVLLSVLAFVLVCSFFCAPLLGGILVCKLNYKFLKNEQAMGIAYDDCSRLMWLVPLTWCFLMFSCISLIDSSFFSADRVMTEAGFDIDPGMDVSNTISTIDSNVVNTGNYVAGVNSHSISTGFTVNGIQTDSNGAGTIMDGISAVEASAHNASNSNVASDIHFNNVMGDSGVPDYKDVVLNDTQMSGNIMEQPIPEQNVTINIKSADTIDSGVVEVPPSHEKEIIEEPSGLAQGSISQINETTTIAQDELSQTVAKAHIDFFGNMHITGVDGMSAGEINSDGVIKGIDGLSDGRIVIQPDNSMIVQDAQGMTISRITPHGMVIDNDGMPMAILKKV